MKSNVRRETIHIIGIPGFVGCESNIVSSTLYEIEVDFCRDFTKLSTERCYSHGHGLSHSLGWLNSSCEEGWLPGRFVGGNLQILRWRGQVVRQKPAKLPFPSSNLGATFSYLKWASMLILIATPIGNLRDLSDRAREALASCDLLCCEDTRHTGLLLQALQITPPKLLSLHKFNEASREDEVISFLQSGKNVGLVSDAGTPAIADPGAALVARCHRENIPVTAIPGPCAFATAYALSGASGSQMQFLGFLPKGHKEREEVLSQMARYDGVSVVYESPHRVHETVACAASVEDSWEIVLVRELTKVYEEVVRLPAKELASRLSGQVVKGECVLVFLPCPRVIRPSDEQLLREVRMVQKSGECSLKEAIEVVAAQYRLSRRDLYQSCLVGLPSN